jgi:hypothetical protein
VARALPFSVSGVDATDKMIQPKAKKVKSKVPISTENLRRSLRFVGQEKVNLAYDTPRKRSKVQPISKVLSLGPAVISSKELPLLSRCSSSRKLELKSVACFLRKWLVTSFSNPGNDLHILLFAGSVQHWYRFL